MTKFNVICAVIIMQFTATGADLLVPSFSVGNPMYEVQFDLIKRKSLIVASPLSYTDKLQKGETYLMPNKKLLYIESEAGNYGDGYKIKRMAIVELKMMHKVKKKELLFFSAFDLDRQVGFNPSE